MQHIPDIPLMDISHEVEPYHLHQAAYVLNAACWNFPDGSIHLALFDIYREVPSRIILCRMNGHYFIAPDNGLLPLAFGKEPEMIWLCLEVTKDTSFSEIIHYTGTLISQLKDINQRDPSLPVTEIKHAPVNLQPVVTDNEVECHVIHIDRFENVVTNLSRNIFDSVGQGRSFRIAFARGTQVNELSSHYNDVRDGERLCRFNSNGFLEISVNRGQAASLFGLQLFQEHHLIYNKIKIIFG